MKKLSVLDLCAGIGGFSLGLEKTGGFSTVAFCEIAPFSRRVLEKNWPHVPIYEDVGSLSSGRLAADGIAGIDVVTAGFPCQDISSAGRKAGLDGERSGLWSEIARLVGELRPRFAVLENSAELLGRGMGRVLGDLASLGYDAEWHCIPAAYVGSPQRRDRVWIVAYPDRWRRQGWTERDGQGPQLEFRLDPDRLALARSRARDARSWVRRADDGVSHRSHRLAALGNAIVPQVAELIGESILEAVGFRRLRFG